MAFMVGTPANGAKMKKMQVVSLCLLSIVSLLPPKLSAQSSRPAESQISSETTAIQALVGEIRQLRLSLERSSFLNMRFQAALQKNQLHNDRVKLLSQQENLVASQLAGIGSEQTAISLSIKDIERNLSNKDASNRRDAEESLVRLKAKLESLGVMDSDLCSRESTLLAEIQREDAQLEDWNRWLQQFEQYLQSVK
jgi:hypothetical protein